MSLTIETRTRTFYRLTNRWEKESWPLHAECKDVLVARLARLFPDSFDSFTGGLVLSELSWPMPGTCIECGERVSA